MVRVILVVEGLWVTWLVVRLLTTVAILMVEGLRVPISMVSASVTL